MTQALGTDDADREFREVFEMLKSEREDSHSKLGVLQLALLRQAARLAVSDDARDAKTLVELLPLCPPVVRRVRLEPTLDEVCAEDREFDLGTLDDADLEALERISSVATGRGEYVPSARRAAALRLVRLLDGRADPADLLPGELQDLFNEVRREVVEVLKPLDATEVFSVAEDLKARTAEVMRLRQEVARLERELHMARSVASGKVSSLTEARRMVSEAEASTLRASAEASIT